MADTSTLTELDGAALARVVVTYRDALRSHQEELNRLNVYPVPDGDTGTNMALTIESVCSEVGDRTRMPEVCKAISHGSLMGARGNSGVILSQILRGLAEVFGGSAAIDEEHVTLGLRQASDAAYQAVMRPVEGTILTVVRSTAEAAEAASTDGARTLSALLERAADAAHDAVADTPNHLPVLKDAGVVDAGGHGFALLLDAFLHVVDGRPLPEPKIIATPAAVAAHERGDDVAELRYEVMFLLDAEDATIPAFKETWSGIGDSIVVTGGDGLWNCHVHTDDIGAAIEAGIEAGRPSRIRVTDLIEQVEEEAWVRDASGNDASDDDAAEVTTAVVAVGVGGGMQRLLRSVGVQEVVAGGQSMNPSTAQILEAVERSRAESVVVLPNNKNIVAVAEQVDALTERAVAVVPTHAVVEALAALVAYDPDASLKDNLVAMTDAAERVNAGEVTQAVRDSKADCGPIAQGDWIAITREGIQLTAQSAIDAALALVGRLVDDDSELVTVLLGADARHADTNRLREHVGLEHPHVELEVHAGDQPLYPYLIGVE
ncbi:MAG: DAK2 domain-containing protein [Actinobacteria bacterium]|nr:DAK2 domain-containing protein [Actinomycetota bacterium]